MSERTLEAMREARLLLLERDPARLGRGTSLQSIRDASWVHQRYALAHGYNSVLELAVDELAAEISSLKQRIDALEARLAGG
jgi:hypothetical protein